jgi:membrane-associated protease RseP (regulator of RpoE activity)
MFILSFILLVAAAMIVHEFGHLIAARACRVPASELGLGLGPKLFGFRVGSVRFSLRAIPVASFVRLDSTVLKQRPIRDQLAVHLGGVVFNVIAGVLTYGTIFSWLNFLLAAGNLLPLYQHDGWKCGVVLMRAWMRRQSQPVEWAFTFSGGFVSLVIAWAVIRLFL